MRVLFGGLWTAEPFGPQWRTWAARLGIRPMESITVLADGAKWIWNQVEQNLPGCSGVLDIYHASEHLYAAAKALHGEGAAEVPAWIERQRQTLLHGGVAALDVALAEQARGLRSPRKRRAVVELRAYLSRHVEHSSYRERLERGQSIGSGMVEGACKTVVGKRLKHTGARWRVRHVERMVALCGLLAVQ